MANGTKKKGSPWKNRIVGTEEVAPDQLLANPANVRVHAKYQQDAMHGAFDTLGWIAPVIVQAGTDLVVDGHMRVAMAISKGERTVPVQYVDLTDEEVKIALATFDPIASLAIRDDALFAELMQEVEVEDEHLRGMLDSMLGGNDMGAMSSGDNGKPKGRERGLDKGLVEHVPEQYVVVINCTSEEEQTDLLSELLERGLDAKALIS